MQSLNSSCGAEGLPSCKCSVGVLHAQVVLCRNKKEPSKYAALKVVFLQSPQVVEDPDHLAIMKQCASTDFLQSVRCSAARSCPCQQAAQTIL